MKNEQAHKPSNIGPVHDATIMIVDDQPSNVHLLQGILEMAGYTNLVSTTEAREALALAESAKPDLILLDLMMPEMDGFEVMEQLKPLIPDGHFLPILVLTADVSKETKRKALAVGASDFLTKPFDHIEVLLRIKNLLQMRYLQLELQQQNESLDEKVKARTEALTLALRQIVTAQETERRRLSMEIHDGPLQSLGVCTVAVDRAIRRHERDEHELVLKELRDLRQNLGVIINEVRGVLGDLSIEILSHYGLLPALRDYVARFSNVTGINVDIRLGNGALNKFPPGIQLLMYRLAQEALANVRKHAHASNAELNLHVEGDNLYMSISDNGRGFNVEEALNTHRAGRNLGLHSMRERIQNAHGEVCITSEPGKGTTLQFRCPLSSNADIEGSVAEMLGNS